MRALTQTLIDLKFPLWYILFFFMDLHLTPISLIIVLIDSVKIPNFEAQTLPFQLILIKSVCYVSICIFRCHPATTETSDFYFFFFS